MDFKKKKLLRTITEIEAPMPQDDLISSYADFLKVRDTLHYHKFNPVVFENLLKLTNNHWKSEKRINRLSLVQTIKKYGYKTDNKLNLLSLEIRKQLFDIFRKPFEDYNFVRRRQLNEVRQVCNYLLINIELSQDEEHWFCENASKSEMILNRVLRYPVKSNVISNWVKKKFYDNNYRNRRAELLSWIIDEQPDFEIDYQTLKDDFEFLNQSDIQAIKDYDDEIVATKIIQEELKDYLPKKWLPQLEFPHNFFGQEIADVSAPELKLSRRFYGVPIDNSKNYPDRIPDFKSLRKEFYSEIANMKKITMIWAIGYSRLDNQTKENLLKKYYCEENYYSFFNVSKKIKSVELLKWLLDKQKRG